MKQFTVYANPNAQSKKRFPYLLNVQTDLLDTLQTCVVAPLAPCDKKAIAQITGLTPLLRVEGRDYLMLTPQIAGVHRRDLGKEVADISEQRDEIIAALDFLISGF